MCDINMSCSNAIEEHNTEFSTTGWLNRYEVLFKQVLQSESTSQVDKGFQSDETQASLERHFKSNPSLVFEMNDEFIHLLKIIYSNSADTTLKALRSPVKDFIQLYKLYEQE